MTGQFDEDRTIDLTLAALGNATPPHGMHDRLLRRLQQQARQAAATPTRRIFPRLSAWPAMLALSATAAAVLVMTVLLHKPAQRNSQPQNFATVRTPIAHKAVTSSTPTKQAETKAPHSAHMAAATYSAALSSAEHHGSDAPGVASAEASFPPPPMPLTEQEKLLLRLAHHGDAIELADLNTQALDAAFEAQKTQFNDFFYIRPKETNNEDQSQQ